MKSLIFIVFILLSPLLLISQNLEVEGKAKITVMDDDITTDSLVVLRPGGELARRHVNSLPDGTGGWTEIVDTTSTMNRVGIGTDSPLAKLNVLGGYTDPLIPGNTSNGILRIGAAFNDGLDIGKKAGGTFDVWLQAGFSGNADPISLQPLGGNVGIGLLSPSAKLEVEGGIKADSLDLQSGLIKNVADPISAQDAVTKNYVDQMSEILLDAGINGIVKDIDGNVYKTIKIGTQVWMAENLKTTKYNDGTVIPEVTNNTAWSNLTTPGYSWYNNNSTLNAKLYGALYNFYTVADTNSMNVCPVGWDVPTDIEWTILTDFLEDNGYGYGGSGTDIGKSMAATFRWNSDATAGTVGNDTGSNNSSGFAGLPGGNRNFNGTFNFIGSDGFWWSSTEINTTFAWYRFLNYLNDDVNRNGSLKEYGFSVRCLRD